MWSGATVPITKQMVAKFNATHPSIHVNEVNVPSADGDAKLLSSIAGGSPPSVFTEWNPVVGEYAQTGGIQPLNRFLTGKYAGLEKWLYPAVLKGGMYHGKVYGLSMSEGDVALYYNKAMLKNAGIAQPPSTIAQLDADQAKLWKTSGGRVQQIGFYPLTNEFQWFMPYFGARGYVNGKYDLAGNKGAIAEMKWLATYNKYPYSAVSALDSTLGTVAGGSEDPFDMGKQAFYVSGAWEGYENIPPDNPSLVGKFGVVPFPVPSGGPTTPSSYVWGNYNVIPKGAKHPSAAFKFIAWLTGYDNVPYTAKILPKGGWVPVSAKVSEYRTYQNWLNANTYLKPFITEFASRYSRSETLTSAESEYTTALATAMEEVATKKMTPLQALTYVDKLANAALAKA